MLGLTELASIAALISAFCDIVAFNREESFGNAYNRYLESPESREQGKILQHLIRIGTYSDEEILAIETVLKNCQKFFENTLDGNQRVKCLCFCLTQARIGNGGKLPIPQWEKTYRQLQCHKQ